jgi:hypothetical protein
MELLKYYYLNKENIMKIGEKREKCGKGKKREKGGKRGLGRERKTEENERKILFQIKICVYLN